MRDDVLVASLNLSAGDVLVFKEAVWDVKHEEPSMFMSVKESFKPSHYNIRETSIPEELGQHNAKLVVVVIVAGNTWW